MGDFEDEMQLKLHRNVSFAGNCENQFKENKQLSRFKKNEQLNVDRMEDNFKNLKVQQELSPVKDDTFVSFTCMPIQIEYLY